MTVSLKVLGAFIAVGGVTLKCPRALRDSFSAATM